MISGNTFKQKVLQLQADLEITYDDAYHAGKMNVLGNRLVDVIEKCFHNQNIHQICNINIHVWVYAGISKDRLIPAIIQSLNRDVVFNN